MHSMHLENIVDKAPSMEAHIFEIREEDDLFKSANAAFSLISTLNIDYCIVSNIMVNVRFPFSNCYF